MKQTVMILFGGESSEHEVSIVSATNVYAALDKEKYDIKLCYISKDGVWHLINSTSDREGKILVPVLGRRIFQVNGQDIALDVLLPVLHGKHGEDGDVQGLARLMHIPCVGPGLIGAAVTMDKDLTKRLLKDAGIPVVDWLLWNSSEPLPAYEEVAQNLGGILFVKPVNAGSSVGVSKVKSVDDYEAAMRLAAEHDSLVMIERAVNAREIEVAVLGNGEELLVSTPGEIVPGEEFYSYDDKYSETSTSHALIPAELSVETIERIKQYARDAYIASRGQGMARLDFFVDRDSGAIYLNEINAIPGFTNISMYPKLMQYDGLDYPGLIDRLIALAFEV